MRIRRGVKWFVALVVVVATAVGLGPTIWHLALVDLRTYLHVSRTTATEIVLVPVGLIVLIVGAVRFRNWFTVRRQHRAARQEALRNLRV